MNEPLRYEQLTETLLRLGFSQDAAEFHGALCGALCVRSPDEIDPLRLLSAAGAPAADALDAEQTLRRLCGQSLEALNSSDMAFSLLLPGDEQALGERVRALSAWCEGFLFGLATRPGLNLKQCSGEAQEIIHDFTEFTRAMVFGGEDDEVEENAYTELVEYIRVGAQLVYMELHERQSGGQALATTLH
jgi:uncharacterized protein